jgi:VWFA-related protein
MSSWGNVGEGTVRKSAVLAFLICYFSTAWGQAPAPSPQAQASADTPNADHSLRLDVVVTDKSGNPVSGLPQQDFTLLDDKRPQPILSFRADDQSSGTTEPVQVIFVIDEVNSGPRALSNARQQLERFLRESKNQLPVPMSLAFFADRSTEVQGAPTRSRTSLIGALTSTGSSLREFHRSSGFYSAAERLQDSIRMLEELTAYESRQPGRKLMIWISPGWPLLSGRQLDISPTDLKNGFQTVVRLSTRLREARVTIYDVDPLGIEDAASFRTFYYEAFLKGVTSANEVENADLSLQVLAIQTGGRVLDRSNDVAGLIATSVADTKAYYKLTFAPAAADDPDEYHDLEVKISKPGLTARTRTGYYAERAVAAK